MHKNVQIPFFGFFLGVISETIRALRDLSVAKWLDFFENKKVYQKIR